MSVYWGGRWQLKHDPSKNPKTYKVFLTVSSVLQLFKLALHRCSSSCPVALFIVCVLQFQEQLGQGCSPEESDTFQAQGQCDSISVFNLPWIASCVSEVFCALCFKDQRSSTRCCSALNIYQSLCHSWRYLIWQVVFTSNSSLEALETRRP